MCSVLIIRKDGQARWFADYTTIIRDKGGTVTHCRGYVTDITKRKESEGALLQKEKQYKDLYWMFRRMCDNMPDMIWGKDLYKRYTFANKVVCDNLFHAKDSDEPICKTDMFFADRGRRMHPHYSERRATA
jgi:PAS domain-containing protein